MVKDHMGWYIREALHLPVFDHRSSTRTAAETGVTRPAAVAHIAAGWRSLLAGGAFRTPKGMPGHSIPLRDDKPHSYLNLSIAFAGGQESTLIPMCSSRRELNG